MQRYFVKNEQVNDSTVTIIGGDFHHIKNVMRMRPGDEVYVVNEDEELFLCQLSMMANDSACFNIIEKLDAKVELPINVTMCYGLVRREKTEEVVKHITELGATGFVQVEMARSIVRLKEGKENKTERLRLISKEASEQSHRTKLMKVYDPIKFKQIFDFAKDYDLCLYAYEESGRSNNYSLKKYLKGNYKNILFLVGPEGGFDLTEVEKLNQAGFVAVGLGPRILRSETAPLYIMSAISYELELNYES